MAIVKSGQRNLASISQEEVLAFLLSLTQNNKQATKRNRYSVLSSFYNFSINNALPSLINPCNTAVIKKRFKRPQTIQWQIVDKEIIDEIIFRTMNSSTVVMSKLPEADRCWIFDQAILIMPLAVEPFLFCRLFFSLDKILFSTHTTHMRISLFLYIVI